jgi:hypothetical protein
MGEHDGKAPIDPMTDAEILAAIDRGMRRVWARFPESSDGVPARERAEASEAETAAVSSAGAFVPATQMSDMTNTPPEAPSHRVVGQLLSLAQTYAMAADANIRDQWIRGSFAAAGFVDVPEIAVHIQELGNLDMMLRSLERETAANGESKEPSMADVLPFGLQVSLSRQWVLSAYEIVRTLSNKWKACEPQAKELLRRLELVRIPLAKLEIAKDRVLGKDGSVELVRRGDPPDKPGKIYTAKDPATYWPQTIRNVATGSIGWDVFDIKNWRQVEILRQDLSNEFLSLLGSSKAEEST